VGMEDQGEGRGGCEHGGIACNTARRFGLGASAAVACGYRKFDDAANPAEARKARPAERNLLRWLQTDDETKAD
jgi:hypothetical protein